MHRMFVVGRHGQNLPGELAAAIGKGNPDSVRGQNIQKTKFPDCQTRHVERAPSPSTGISCANAAELGLPLDLQPVRIPPARSFKGFFTSRKKSPHANNFVCKQRGLARSFTAVTGRHVRPSSKDARND